MTGKNLIIYSGPVKSGKSSQLYKFFKDRENVAGILSLLIEGKKYLYSIQTKEKKLLEVDKYEDETEIIKIGNYNFDKCVFKWGREILLDGLKKGAEWLIIDEIGPLELSGNGLAPVAFEIIEKSLNSSQKVVVVLREVLLKKFLEQIALTESGIEFFNFNLSK